MGTTDAIALNEQGYRKLQAMALAFDGTPRADAGKLGDGRVTSRLPQHRIGKVTVAVGIATYAAGVLVTLGTGKMKFHKAESDGSGVGDLETEEWDVLNLSATGAIVGQTLLALRAQDLQSDGAAKPGWFVSPVTTGEAFEIKPCELCMSTPHTVTTAAKTRLQFTTAKNLNTEHYAVYDLGGAPLTEPDSITLLTQGWYEIGYSIDWEGPITTAGNGDTTSADIEFSFGDLVLEMNAVGVPCTTVAHGIVHHQDTGESLGGSATRQVLYRRGVSNEDLRAYTTNGSATHNRTFSGVMWALYLGHDDDPTTTINDGS